MRIHVVPNAMKSTKVQTLGAVAWHATTACTDDTSIAGLCPFHSAIVSCLVFHAVGSVHVRVCIYYSLVSRLGPLLTHVQLYR